MADKDNKWTTNKTIMYAAVAGAVIFLVLVYVYVSWGVEEEAFTSEIESGDYEVED